MDISVIIPIYNEEENILVLVRRLVSILQQLTEKYELLLVDDGSTDTSLSIIQELSLSNSKIRYFSLSRNFGHQIAVSCGVDHAAGDAVVIIDADLQDPPELIPALYAKLKEGYKVVHAKRNSRKGESLFKRITAKVFYRLLASITHFDFPLDVGDFRMIDRDVVMGLRQMPERNKFIRGQISWLGYSTATVTYDRDERSAGKSGYTLGKMIKLAYDAITAFSDKPLRLATFLGFTVSSFSFLIIIYALVSKFVWKEAISGWTSIMVSTMFIGGVQLLSLGIIGEYISRMNSDVRQRPLYVVEEKSAGEN